MHIEVSPEDLKLILTSLESHERIGIADNMVVEMITATLLGGLNSTEEEKQKRKEGLAARMKAADVEAALRRLRALPLRARLSECLTRESEFQSR